MHIINRAAMAIESPLCLGCSDATPRNCDREYEMLLLVSVGQATYNTDVSHFS